MLQKAVNILKSFEADKGSKVEYSSMGKIQKRPGSEEVTKLQREGYISGSLSSSITEEKLEQINKKLQQQGVQSDFQVPLPTGLPFKNYGYIHNVFDDNKSLLSHKLGEVLLVDVWATWCPPCQKPMAHNQTMLEKNEERWKDKVRIVGVSVDEDKDDIKARIQQKGWNKITHLTLLGWRANHGLIKDYKIQGIPFIILVDKFGKTNYVGHPAQINLELRINQLIAQQSQGQPVAEKTEVSSQNKEGKSTQDLHKLIESFSKETVTEIFKDVELFCFIYTLKQSYSDGKDETQLKIKAFIIKGDENGKNKVKKFFGTSPNLTVQLEEIEFIDVPFEQKPDCWKCSSSLSYPYYWLKWEEGTKYGCRKCVEEKSSQQGHHYAYEKNSILLMGKWDKISAKKVGKNIQPEDVSKVEDPNQFLCNSCSKCPSIVGQARYVCLGCRPEPNFKGDHDDLCVNCLELLTQDDQKTLKSLDDDKHDKNHPLLRILYNVKGYYDY